jgi:hypothetical protein
VEDARDPRRPAARGAWVAPAIAYAVLGFLAVWGPWVAGGSDAGNPVDGMSLLSLPLLFAVGLLVGVAWPSARLALALLTMAGLVARIPIDWVSDPTSHNLFPLELGVYALLSLLAMLGAYLGRRLRRPQPA